MSHEDDSFWAELSEVMAGSCPPPDPVRRAEVIVMACEKNEMRLQETAGSHRQRNQKARQIADAAKEGMTWMSRKLSLFLAGGTAITTSLVALFALNIAPQQGPEALSVPEVMVTELAPAPSADLSVADIYEAPNHKVEILSRAGGSPSSPMRQSEGIELMSKKDGPAVMMAQPAFMEDVYINEPVSEDRFVGQDINSVKLVGEDPVSTFSIDVDTASWSFARRMIRNGQVPSPDMVRIEEMVNYFDYGYQAPAADAEDPFSTHVSVFEAPWNEDKQLVRIGIQGMEPDLEDRPPLDLAFLIDTSGSMESPDKLGLLKKSLVLMLSELQEGDRVGIVVYAGSAGVVLEMTEASSRQVIIDALGNLQAGGSTAGAEGLRAAYQMIGKAKEEGRIGRVILATDGDFNVGLSSDEEMKDFIEDRREEGAYLSILGFGAGNYNDGLMQVLAQNGNGQAAYIDTLSEARKVLVDQLSGALYPIADDVKIQVEFNPDVVHEYRLIGYETRSLAREDFNNDKVDAGEIGAGHQVTALYEISLVGSDGAEISPLRYGDVPAPKDLVGELGYVNLRYKEPGGSESILIGTPILPATGVMDHDAKFAAAISGFAQLMKDDKYLDDWSYADAAELANSAKGEDPFGYRAEAVRLIQLMEVLDQ